MKFESFEQQFVLHFSPSYSMVVGHIRLSKSSCVSFDNLQFFQGMYLTKMYQTISIESSGYKIGRTFKKKLENV